MTFIHLIHTLKDMKNHRILWTFAALWDFVRIGLLFLFYTVNDGILDPYGPLVLASLLGPFLVFPFWALTNSFSCATGEDGPQTAEPWKTGKILSLGATVFLLIFLGLNFAAGRGAIPTVFEIVRLFGLGGALVLGDLWILGLVHFLVRPPKPTAVGSE